MATLLGEWGFLDNLQDTSGFDHHGVASNYTPSYVAGPQTDTRAIEFTGTNNMITLGRTGLEPTTRGLTTMAWVWLPNTWGAQDGVGLIHGLASGNSIRHGFYFTGTTHALRWLVRWKNDLQFSTGSPVVGLGSWHHITQVDSDRRWDILVDGVPVASGSRAFDASPWTSWEDTPWTVGDDLVSGTSVVGARMTGIRIFQGALSTLDVNTWMNTPITTARVEPPTVAQENAKTGESSAWYTISGAGDQTNQGFCRQFSVNVGETAEFSCSGDGTVMDIYRIGWYAGLGWRKVSTLYNAATVQPAPVTVPNSNGAIQCSDWSVTSTWTVPPGTRSGFYVGVLRNAAVNNASWIPFIVRDDEAEVDLLYKTSDATWALAYNCFGAVSVTNTVFEGGKNMYGMNTGVGNITDRCHYVSYHRPIITRLGVPQTYWYACEYPMIRFLERNGYDMKYAACKDLDRDASIFNKCKVFLSSGHDEYWSQEMRDNLHAWRDDVDSEGRSVFFSANEVFWRIRYDDERNGFWCYKDTMPGPGGHSAGVVLDPVHWTGTFKDQRQPGFDITRDPEWITTGTDFRMNGVNDYDAIVVQNPYSGHPVWANSALLDGNVTLTRVIGFEADDARPTQPDGSVRVLAAYTRSINGARADDNGQVYTGNGNLTWGVVSQRYESGGVTIGFGTCQWSWALDDLHDRTTTPTSPAAQQFTINLLTDLGAIPSTLMSGRTTRPAVALDNYGTRPGRELLPATVYVLDTVDEEWKSAEILGFGDASGVLHPALGIISDTPPLSGDYGDAPYGDGDYGG